MREVLFVVRHAKCDLWIAERAGSMCRWDDRSQAMAMTVREWEAALSPDLNRALIVYEVAS